MRASSARGVSRNSENAYFNHGLLVVTEGEFVLLAKCKQGIDRLIGVCLRLALHPGSHRFQCPRDDLFRRMEAAGVELFFDEAFGAGIEVEDHLL